MIYEILYIVPSKFSDSEIDGVTKTVDGLFAKHGAKAVKTENLGKLKFAYPIKKFTHGTYVLTYVESEGTAVSAIDLELKLASEVLRHVIVKREEGIPTFEYKLSSYVAPITPEGRRATGAPEAVVPSKKAPAVAKSAPADIVTSETVDEKLDDILGDDTVEEVIA
jgi:small subunit ribosomal protein S6